MVALGEMALRRLRRLNALCCVLLVALGATTFPAYGLTLAEAIALARKSDPVYLGAQASLEAARKRSLQAIANLLPQVTGSTNTTANRRNYDLRETTLPETNERFNSNGAQINLTQPLWRSANRIAVTQADAAVSQAEYQRAAAEQDLLVRLAQAWFDLMLARDVLMFTKYQELAAKTQWQQLEQAVRLGLAATPALEEARAKLDQASADYVGAEMDQNIKLAALEQIIGPVENFVPPSLTDGYRSADVSQGMLVQWLQEAETLSPVVQSAARALEAAREEIRKQRAGHEPTLDVVASYGWNAQGAGSTPTQSAYASKQSSVGFQLNIPIFSGGGNSAKVDEAIALKEKAAQELELARRNARQAAKQAWFNMQGRQAKQTAALQGVRFATISLRAARSGLVTGMKTELDVLQANQQLYSTLRDLQNARYDLITSQFKLKAVAGQLRDADLSALDEWFERAQEQIKDRTNEQTKEQTQASLAAPDAGKHGR